MRVLEGFLCLLGLLGVYLLASSLIVSGTIELSELPGAGHDYMYYVRPAPDQWLAPAAAIVATWLLLLAASTRTTLRKTQ